MVIFTVEDFKNLTLLELIQKYKNSDVFIRARQATAYYNQENSEIMKRTTFLQMLGFSVPGGFKVHKICSGFFRQFVLQETQYLLWNGIEFHEKPEIKQGLGRQIDARLRKLLLNGCLHGRSFGYFNQDTLEVFTALEGFPIVEKFTGDIVAFVRFVEIEGSVLVQVFEGQTLKTTVFKDGIKESTKEEAATSKIIPFYADENKRSRLTDGIKNTSDAYDFILSDLVDTITIQEGITWTLANFGAAKDPKQATEMVALITALKTAYVDGEKSTAKPHIIEAPFSAKQTALQLLEERLYSDAMALNTKALTGGSLTNVAINVAKTDFDLKVNLLEGQLESFVYNLIDELKLPEDTPVFKRRTLTNDTEIIRNLNESRHNLDLKTYLQLHPFIDREDVDEVLGRIASEQLDYLREGDQAVYDKLRQVTIKEKPERN